MIRAEHQRSADQVRAFLIQVPGARQMAVDWSLGRRVDNGIRHRVQAVCGVHEHRVSAGGPIVPPRQSGDVPHRPGDRRAEPQGLVVGVRQGRETRRVP